MLLSDGTMVLLLRRKVWEKEVNPSIAQFTSTFAGEVGVHG
jgi:hypothetical protein